MKIINNDKTKEIKFADNYFKRLKGLMFKRDIDYGILLKVKYSSSVHTNFMFFPIDVYFIRNGIIYEKITLETWSYYSPLKEADFVLEFKKDDFKIKKGDEILVTQNNQEYLKAFRKW